MTWPGDTDFAEYCAADYFSKMWSAPHKRLYSPLYGPSQIYFPSSRDLDRVLSDLARAVRDICLLHLHRRDANDDANDELDSRLIDLSKHFYFKNSAAVGEFIKARPFLIDILLQARSKIEEAFSSATLTNLELFSDPEEDDRVSKLFVLILTSLPARNAASRLDDLDRSWWLHQDYEVRSSMNIDIKYTHGSV